MPKPLTNSRTIAAIDPATGQFQPKRWKDVRVGDVLKVLSDETLPCDIVLLATSDPTGVAYLQTINLHGESNLKSRYAKQETVVRSPEMGGAVGLLIRCERLNRNIYGFHANMKIDGKRISLGSSNIIILRGCELKNTAWIVGFAVYTGRETKGMLSGSRTPSKRSGLENHMNRETLLLSAFLVVLSSVVSVLNGIWVGNHKGKLEFIQYFRKRDHSDLNDKNKNYNYYGIGVQIFFTFLMSVIVI